MKEKNSNKNQKNGIEGINVRHYIENLSEKDCKGSCNRIPLDVLRKMVENQVEQGNKPDVKVFQEERTVDVYNGGFNWSGTLEGTLFWMVTLMLLSFDGFFAMYPMKKKNSDERKDLQDSYLNGYIRNLSEKDCKGSLKGISLDILKKMIRNQAKQGNRPDVSIFQKERTTDRYHQGFDWDCTLEGRRFWSNNLGSYKKANILPNGVIPSTPKSQCILDKAERDYLSMVLHPFMKKINYIMKGGTSLDSCIHVYFINGEQMIFPHFTGSSMYAGMVFEKHYFPEELGLR